MKVEQIYTGCLAQGAYYIESNGEAVVIDPLREVEPYIQKAERNNAKIKYVLSTGTTGTMCRINNNIICEWHYLITKGIEQITG